jgi:hypothetical protein
MGRRQWGRRAEDAEPEAHPRTVSLPLRQVPLRSINPPSRHRLHAASGVEESQNRLRELIAEFTEAAEDGVALDSRGLQFSFEALRGYRRALSYVDSELGAMAVQDVRRRHVQELITQLSSSGLATARVVAVVDALGSLYSYAIRRDLVDFSPVVELQLPGWEGDISSFASEPPQPFATGDPRTSPPATAPGGTWPPPSFMPPGGTWPPNPFMVDPRTPPAFMAPGNGWAPAASGHMSVGPGQPQLNGHGHAASSGMFPSPGTMGVDASYDATMQERWLWWTVRIIVIVFVLIALVLVAESV